MDPAIYVNQERLWHAHLEIAKIGALPNGGCRRLALSEEDKAGRDLFVSWCEESGCRVEVDQVGNIYARRAGKNPDLPAIATGSHLDTQPHGGRFDGIYGVLAGLEVVRSLNDANVETQAPFDIVVWTNEEGARFSPPLTGSSAFVGNFDVEFVHNIKTRDQTRVGDDLANIGYLGELRPGARQFDSFFEAHIEQGPVLESADRAIGVVTAVQGIRWLYVKVDGTDSHAGTVPMNMRRDALAGAARMIARINDLVADDPNIRLTVGQLNVSPNSGSTIPGHVNFNVDLRHPVQETLDHFDAAITSGMAEIAQKLKLGFSIETKIDAPPIDFDDEIVGLIESSSVRLGYKYMKMISGAGHDAMNIATKYPTAMVFVPCKDGISHNETEYATPQDLAAGTNVLLNAMIARDKSIQ